MNIENEIGMILIYSAAQPMNQAMTFEGYFIAESNQERMIARRLKGRGHGSRQAIKFLFNAVQDLRFSFDSFSSLQEGFASQWIWLVPPGKKIASGRREALHLTLHLSLHFILEDV
jgi:hypothetical protein